MNRWKSISTVLLFLVLVFSSVNGAVFHGGPESTVARNNGHQMVPADSYTLHAPITITSNADFISQGWPGSGISGDPYVIEGLNITADAICISISDTTVYFEVRDCVISPESSYIYDGIFLSNVIHGTIQDCIIELHYRGIHLFESSSCTLTNNIATNNYRGIYLHHSDNCTLTDNTASSNSYYGFNLSSVDNCTLTNNTATNNSYGFFMRSLDNSTLMNNTATNNSYGFHLDFSDSCTLTNNTATNNIYYGLHLDYSDSCTLTNNTASRNDYGIYLKNSSSCTLTNNTASSNDYGIYLRYSSSFILTDNTASRNSDDGFYLYSSYNCTLIHNTASSNKEEAFVLTSSYNCILMHNTASNSIFHGFYLTSSDNCTLTNNTASSNDYGIYLRYSSSCTMTNNTANNNFQGFYLEDSDNCTFISNTAFNNSYYGVYLLTGSANNTLYLNRLGNNGMSNARDDGGSNIWDDGISSGNYWIDYKGTGTYLIPGDAGSVDNYPDIWDPTNIQSEMSPLISYYITFGGIFAVLLIAIAYSGNRRRSKSSVPEIQTSDLDSYQPVSQETPPVQQSPEITVEEKSPLTNQVEVLRGCEMVGGDFEYKVKVKNDTRYVIDNVVVSLVAYPDDCMIVDGPTSKKISRIEPGGFRSPLFKFTPTKDCVEGKIMASVSYMNHENKLHMKEVNEFTIKSVCDLLKPLESTLDQFNSFLDGMYKTSSTHELEWNPQVLYEKARILLPSRNFFIVESTVEKIGDSFNGIIRGLALGKYTNKKVAIRVLISGSIKENTAKVVLEGLGEDEAMLPTALSELTTGIDAWICLNCGASLGVNEVSLIRSKNAIECGYCKRTLTHELYIK